MRYPRKTVWIYTIENSVEEKYSSQQYKVLQIAPWKLNNETMIERRSEEHTKGMQIKPKVRKNETNRLVKVFPRNKTREIWRVTSISKEQLMKINNVK